MKQVIHSKFKPMKREPLFVALSNQKGGVGKSTFTVLLASYFHYLNGYNVLVVDCDYPQHSISAMRDWEVGNIEKNVHPAGGTVRNKRQESLQHPELHPGGSQGDGRPLSRKVGAGL